MNQAGYNSQRQVAHINDGTWTSKMLINSANPYLPQPEPQIVPKSVHYQFKGAQAKPATGTLAGQPGDASQDPAPQTRPLDHSEAACPGQPKKASGSPAPHHNLNTSAQFNPNWIAANKSIIDQGQSWNRGTAAPDQLDQQLHRSSTGHILNQTRSVVLNGHEYPKILDEDLIVTDGTLKPGYSRPPSPSRLRNPHRRVHGHGRRIAADNIYGSTFAHARQKAEVSRNRLINERESNIVGIAESIPPLKTNHPTHHQF